MRRPGFGWIAGFVLAMVATSYFWYHRGFEAGRDYSARADSTGQKKWVSKKWRYEVTFPEHWGPMKRDDPSVIGGGADIFCGSGRSPSTAVFASRRMGADSLDSVSRHLLQAVQKAVGDIEIVEQKGYAEGAVERRRIILKAGENTCYYSLVLGRETVLIISCNSLTGEFESARRDFDGIIESVRFF